MAKQFQVRSASMEQREPNVSDMEEYEFDDDEFFEQYTKHSRKTTKRSKEARRKIEQLKEDRELQKRLNECYLDVS